MNFDTIFVVLSTFFFFNVLFNRAVVCVRTMPMLEFVIAVKGGVILAKEFKMYAFLIIAASACRRFAINDLMPYNPIFTFVTVGIERVAS